MKPAWDKYGTHIRCRHKGGFHLLYLGLSTRSAGCAYSACPCDGPNAHALSICATTNFVSHLTLESQSSDKPWDLFYRKSCMNHTDRKLKNRKAGRTLCLAIGAAQREEGSVRACQGALHNRHQKERYYKRDTKHHEGRFHYIRLILVLCGTYSSEFATMLTLVGHLCISVTELGIAAVMTFDRFWAGFIKSSPTPA